MEEKKMTVEQIKAAANEQISVLYQKLQEANLANAFKRLDYLFKIVEGTFDEDAKVKAREEIVRMVLTPTEEGKEKNKD